MKKCSLLLILLFVALPAFAEGNPTYLGKTPPAFSFGRFVNADLPFEDLASLKGDVVLLEFFRTSCPPCRASMKLLEKTYQTHRRPDLHIIATTGDSYDLVRRFLYHHPEAVFVHFPIAVECRGNWGVRYVPMAYIIGRDGKVFWAGNPHTGYQKALEKALAAPAPELQDVPKKLAKHVSELYAEQYAKALRGAKKAREAGNAAFAEWMEKRVKTFHERYMFQVEAAERRGDYYLASTILKRLSAIFRSTPYEEDIKKKLSAVNKEHRKEIKLWGKYHEIIESARTAKKSAVEKALKDLNKLVKKHDGEPIADAVADIVKVLKNPWSAREAASR